MTDTSNFKQTDSPDTQISTRVKYDGMPSLASGTDKSRETEHETNSDSGGFSLAESARSLAYSAIQKPVTGVAQLVDNVAGTHIAVSTQMVDQPKEATFGSVQWHVNQVASGVGAFVPYVAAMAMTRGALKSIGAENVIAITGSNAGTAASVYRTGEAAAAGFVNGMILEPTNDQKNFFGDRVHQGIVSGVNFGTMHAVSNPLSRLTGASALEASLLNRASTTALAGVAGGIASSLTDSALAGRSIDTKDLAKTAYQSAFTGLTLGAGADHFLRLHQPKSNFPEAQAFVSTRNGLSDHSTEYMLWHDQQTLSGTLKLNSRIALALLQNKELENQNFFGRSPLERVELVRDFERRGDAFFTKPDTLKEINSIFDKQADLTELMMKSIEAGEKRRSDFDQSAWWTDAQSEKTSNSAHKAAEENRAKIQTEIDLATNERTRSLEHDINEFLDKHDLPRVQLISDGESNHYGWLRPGGLLGISTGLLDNTTLHHKTVDTMVHELTHLRQDTLTVRRIADEMQLGKEATPEQLEQLTEKYIGRWTDPSLSHEQAKLAKPDEESSIPQLTEERLVEYLQNILRIRDGKPLTKDELRDAKAIDQTQFANAIERQRAEQQLDVVGRFASSTMPLVSFDKLFYDLVKEPEKFKAETGFETIPEPMLNFAKKHFNGEFDPSKSHDLLDEHYDPYEHLNEWDATMKPLFVDQEANLHKQIGKNQNRSFNLYYGDPGERTAHPTGRLAGFAYEGRDYAGLLPRLKAIANHLAGRDQWQPDASSGGT